MLYRTFTATCYHSQWWRKTETLLNISRIEILHRVILCLYCFCTSVTDSLKLDVQHVSSILTQLGLFVTSTALGDSSTAGGGSRSRALLGELHRSHSLVLSMPELTSAFPHSKSQAGQLSITTETRSQKSPTPSYDKIVPTSEIGMQNRLLGSPHMWSAKSRGGNDKERWKRQRGKFFQATLQAPPSYTWLPFLGILNFENIVYVETM